MAKGISLHLGLNKVNPAHYAEWKGHLNAAEYDAKDMARLVKAYQPNFETKILLSPNTEGYDLATKDIVVSEITTAATRLVPNDLFVLTYSGHGGILPNLNKDPEKPDYDYDQTYCLYDELLIDDEMIALWAKFKQGVRILVISDCCHSGSIVKIFDHSNLNEPCFRSKNVPDKAINDTYLAHKDYYDKILNARSIDPSDIKASLVSISACQDEEYTYDGDYNSEFTKCLKDVWNFGRFQGNYLNFHQNITFQIQKIRSKQTPNYITLGKPMDNFYKQKPFKIV